MEPGEPTGGSPRDKGVLFIGQAPGNPGIRLGSPGLRCRVWGARAAAAIGPPGPQPCLGPATSPQEAELGPKQLRCVRPAGAGGGGLLTVSASPWDSHTPEESSEPHMVPEGTGKERDLRPVTPPPPGLPRAARTRWRDTLSLLGDHGLPCGLECPPRTPKAHVSGMSFQEGSEPRGQLLTLGREHTPPSGAF